jgi:hypothetical protein
VRKTWTDRGKLTLLGLTGRAVAGSRLGSGVHHGGRAVLCRGREAIPWERGGHSAYLRRGRSGKCEGAGRWKEEEKGRDMGEGSLLIARRKTERVTAARLNPNQLR